MNIKTNGNGKITINGQTINTYGKSVSISNNNVFIDGIEINDIDISNDKIINVKIEGTVESVDCNGSVEVIGDVGDIDCGGGVKVSGNMKGSIDCGGSIRIGGNHSNGKIDAGGFVNIG